MTLHKDQPTRKYLFGLIELGPREKQVQNVKWKWITWVFLIGAVLIVAGAITAAILNGISFF
jgi:hypothetical protein